MFCRSTLAQSTFVNLNTQCVLRSFAPGRKAEGPEDDVVHSEWPPGRSARWGLKGFIG